LRGHRGVLHCGGVTAGNQSAIRPKSLPPSRKNASSAMTR
jgi:hypothetical protein